MAKVQVKELATKVLDNYLKEQGLELYDVEYVKEGKDWFLRVYIDKVWEETEEFVALEDCEKTSRFLSEKLDELDPIEQNYYLEVSSPGMERKLKTQRDFTKYKGRTIEVSLYEAYHGQKKYQGILLDFLDGNLCIQDEKKNEFLLPFDKVAKANIKVVF